MATALVLGHLVALHVSRIFASGQLVGVARCHAKTLKPAGHVTGIVGMLRELTLAGIAASDVPVIPIKAWGFVGVNFPRKVWVQIVHG